MTTHSTDSPLTAERVEELRAIAHAGGCVGDELNQVFDQALREIRLRQDNETLRAQLHGMQDGSLLRDTLALNNRLRDEQAEAAPAKVREETIEECAKVADKMRSCIVERDGWDMGILSRVAYIIRTLKRTPAPTLPAKP